MRGVSTDGFLRSALDVETAAAAAGTASGARVIGDMELRARDGGLRRPPEYIGRLACDMCGVGGALSSDSLSVRVLPPIVAHAGTRAHALLRRPEDDAASGEGSI